MTTDIITYYRLLIQNTINKPIMKVTFKHTVIALMTPFMLASCSSDDISTDDSTLWKGTLADAPYAADAALYEINDVNGDTDITSIELTGSGIYFISYKSDDEELYPDYPEYGDEEYYLSSNAFRSRAEGRDSDFGQDVRTGSFTRLPDNGWHLDGFGDMIYRDGYIEVTLDSGEKLKWSATEAPHIEDNVLNNRICRTWRLKAARIEFLDAKNNVVKTHTYADAEIDDEYMRYCTFTRSGKLYQYDDDDENYRLNWGWSNSRSQLITLTEDTDEYEGWSMIQVFFDNNDMTILIPEQYSDNDELQWEYEDIISGIPSSAIATRQYLTATNYTAK